MLPALECTMVQQDPAVIERLTRYLTTLISETNGLSLDDTLELAEHSALIAADPEMGGIIRDFRSLLGSWEGEINQVPEPPHEHFVDARLDAGDKP